MTRRRKTAPALGPRLQALRRAHSLTLEQLSERSGLSKSMLSQIERGQTNPTFGTLWSLTQSLGIEFSELVEGAQPPVAAAAEIDLVAQHATPTIKSADGKCLLNILSPARLASDVEWYRLTVKPGGALVSDPHGTGAEEHLTCLVGQLQVRSGGAQQSLTAGDTVRYRGDLAHAISNPGKVSAEALLIVINRPRKAT